MKRPHPESGFALLFVLLMAAMIAISLYLEIPRVAFQAQREKEQMLIDRGEQYKRAIQVFTRKTNRWPQSIDELENYQNQHFLRRRFRDPLTGKDEWRLIHVANGVLTDSELQKSGKDQKNDKDKPDPNAYVGQLASAQVANFGQPQGGANQTALNAMLRRRMSEGGTAGAGAVLGMNGQPVSPALQAQMLGQAGQPGQTTGLPGQPPIPGVPHGVPGIPGVPGQQVPGAAPGNPAASSSSGSSYIGTGSPYIGGSAPVQVPVATQAPFPGRSAYPGMPGAPVSSQTGGVSPAYGASPYSTAAGAQGGSPGFTQPGTNPQAQNAAALMIQQILTTPRPGGMPGAAGTVGGIMGNGIAGVASKVEGDAIKSYDDQTEYDKWEFVFDVNKIKPLFNPNTGAVGTPAGAMGSNPGNTNGLNPVAPNPAAGPGASPSPFGGASPFGAGSQAPTSQGH